MRNSINTNRKDIRKLTASPRNIKAYITIMIIKKINLKNVTIINALIKLAGFSEVTDNNIRFDKKDTAKKKGTR
ncbi:MAG: hypothetical protein PHR81_00025 [Bacteroidales bacterium]|jgi:hypothetical protein|nr:hypothetical protein [Bacteroidales bacterium]MDD4213172.1 hypothetical protein [Bacteroidales bacterium]